MGFKSLNDFMRVQQEAIERRKKQDDNAINTDYFSFDRPDEGQKVSFKARILPKIVNGKVTIMIDMDDGSDDQEMAMFFVQQKRHKGFFTNKKPALNLLCPNMFGENCPICTKRGDRAMINEIYEYDKKHQTASQIYKNLRGKISYYLNIFVTEHEQYPDYNGKVSRIYLPEDMINALIAEMQDKDMPEDLLTLEHGKEVKFTISINDRGYNSWSHKVLRTVNISKKLNVKDIPEFDKILEFEKNKLPIFEDYHNIVYDVLVENCPEFNPSTPKTEVEPEVKQEPKQETKQEEPKNNGKLPGVKKEEPKDDDYESFIDEI